ncbi:MAG: phosphonate transport system substrate-binding protein, partial [Pseudomonadota bacterium]|nr:phosphonate transport system substrate-binding protein [Pseudomonadota bacterium]
AGAVKDDVFLQYESRGLRSLATSMPLSDHLFVAGNRLPAEKVRRLQALLQQLHQSPGGSQILNTLTRGVTALLPVQDSDYDSLRAVLTRMKDLGVSY